MVKAISRKRWGLLLLPILLLGAILRLIRLGQQSFWWDEVYSANLAAKSLATVVPRFGQTPTLYPILLHFWSYMGHSDTMLRLLSVLFGIITLWVVYLIGKNLLDARHGLLCSLLMAISPFHIWYSREARMYSLLILLSAASVLFFIKFLQKQKGWPGVWWALSTGLAIYTHYYAVFILIFEVAIFLLFWHRYHYRWRSFCYVLGSLVAMMLPMLFLFFLGGRYATLSAEGAGENPIQLFSILYTFFAFSLGLSYGPSIAELHRCISLTTVQPYLAQILPVALLFSAIFVLGLGFLWHRREKLVFLLLYLIVPIAGASLLSLLWPQISYNVRYVSTALPAYGFILARGLLAPRNRTIRWVLVLLILTGTFISLHNYYCVDKYGKADYRSAAQFVSAHSEDSDVILAPYLELFKYYYRGPSAVRKLLWSPKLYRKAIKMRVRGFNRTWLVISREWKSDPKGEMVDYVRETFPAVLETTFTNLYLGLYETASTQRD